MSVAEAASALSVAPEARECDHVLAGVMLEGAAKQLASMLDRGFLDEVGWDLRMRLLRLPAQHRLLGRRVCRADGCERSFRDGLPEVCLRCFTRLSGLGMTTTQIATASALPAAHRLADRCAVPGCQCVPTVRAAVLCQPHAMRFRARRPRRSLEEFLADPRVRALPAMPACQVVACTRPADGASGYCNTHSQRWRTALPATPGLDRHGWQRRESGVAEPGQVNLRALPSLVVLEVLFGVQQRVGGGVKVTDVDLRVLCDALRRQRASSIAAGEVDAVLTKPVRSLLNALRRHVRRALVDPDTERAKDVWDLAIFGHRGNLSFTEIAQSWLAQAAKRWAGEQWPRHRGRGAARVRSKINGLGLLSEYLTSRPDRGLVTTALGRSDVEGFLNRLGYLESTGRISRYRRNGICRDVREVLAGIRALGLTRPGAPAAGLPGDFAIERGDIPADPERGEPCRDLPPEIMAMLCANLDTLEPPEVRVAAQLGIDTGRRPEDILGLPLDCLARDSDGGTVLVYDNAKADRLGRRLPINQATAAVITAQQNRVRQRFPDTPAGELRLLPSPRRNPHGHRAISIDMLEGRHREWVEGLSALLTRDGVEFDKTKIVPYAYRHSYAQRHADAGVGIDVLAELLDHRNLNVTRSYYRVGEDRRRAAVDTVTAMSFDRHGDRIWRDAQDLLDSEHARYAVGEVAVPYGRCSEPSNVAAGGNACPVRFRCAGCDHFRTDVSYLPDLSVYLDDLLRTRERLAAAIDGVDVWARVAATPSQEEITRIRRLIGRINNDLDQTDDTERAGIDEAVAVLRRHRTVSLGMPTLGSSRPDVLPEATA